MKKFVYLAGPILGCTKGEANDWRAGVASKLAKHDIIGISPLRCEPIIGDRYEITYDADPMFGTARAIASKNNYDTRECDMVLVYLPKPPEGRHQSYGSIIELGWAHSFNKPTILVSDDPEIVSHALLTYCSSWLFNSLDHAVETIIGVLGGYTGGKNV